MSSTAMTALCFSILVASPAAAGAGPISAQLAISFPFASAALDTPQDRAQVDLIYTGPMCPAAGSVNINLVGPLLDKYPGRIDFGPILPGLSYEGNYLLAEQEADAESVARAFATEPNQPAPELLAAEIPVLVSPYEIVFQYPYAPHADLLATIEEQVGPRRRFPDTHRTTARLLRYKSADGRSMLHVALAGGEAKLPADLLDYEERVWLDGRVELEDYRGHVISIGLPSGSAEYLLGRLSEVRGQSAPAATMFLHPGGLLADTDSQAEQEYCASTLHSLGVSALVPRADELGLGPARLRAIIAQFELPYVAANLKQVGAKEESARPFPRFIVRDVNGLTVAVIGIVARGGLERLSASARAQWEVENPATVLPKVIEALHTQLRRRPDLTVVLVGGTGQDIAAVAQVDFVDAVIGEMEGGDSRFIKRTVQLDPGAPDSGRLEEALFFVRTPESVVGRLRVEFARGQGPSPARLLGGEESTWPVLAEGPRDDDAGRAWRKVSRVIAQQRYELALPDAAKVLERRPEVASLVWGERVLHRGGFRKYERTLPARYTDPLWMRLITNVMLTELGLDVAVSRNLPRVSDFIGPITQGVLGDWLRAADGLRVVELSGAELARLAARVEQQETPGAVEPLQWLFVAGLDPKKLYVRGRPIDANESYRVVTTDTVMEMESVRELFLGRPVVDKFVTPATDSDAIVADQADGKPLEVRAVAQRAFARDNARFGITTAEREEALANDLADFSSDRPPLWRLQSEELSVSGAVYTNTGSTEPLAATRETRVTTPNNYQLGAKSNLAVIYDTATFAWETRLRTVLQRVVIHIPGQEVPAQEQNDDIVASAELRLNAVQLTASSAGIPIVPFVQVAYDTEFTPVHDAADNSITLPLQKLGRFSSGVVAYPGGWLRELRVGGVYQMDVSTAEIFHDGGITCGLKVRLPLVGALRLEDTLDVRYFFDDGDDRVVDLGLVMANTTRLVAPFTGAAALFLFADYYGARGKRPETRDLGGSVIYGAGLDFAGLLKL